MTIELVDHQYGKAQIRLVRVVRDTPRHQIRDLNVTTTLRGDFDAAYRDGDQSNVLPTDTQKNTAYAYARRYGVDPLEEYAIRLARHFVDDIAPVHTARVAVEEYAWRRAVVDGAEHPHTFVQASQAVRTLAATVTGRGPAQQVEVSGGVKDLVLLKSTGSEFAGFLTDPYTTLEPTHDRIMATSLDATWRFTSQDVAWDQVYDGICELLIAHFATVHSLALQQTLWHMGRAVLAAFPQVSEIHLVAPNRHHFLVDLAPFGLDNPGEVFHADDRPYGLIEATVGRGQG